MALKPITAATELPITLAEAKAQANVIGTDDDDKITAFIWAATAIAEQLTERAVTTQTGELTLDAFPDALKLTRTPVQSISSITYADAAGASTVLDSSAYALDNADAFGPAYVVPAYATSWPATRDQINAVAVRFVAGYASAAAVPPGIKNWIKLMVAAMVDNPSGLADGKFKSLGYVDRLLDGAKVYG